MISEEAQKAFWLKNNHHLLRELQSATGEEVAALLPSVLDRAFKGEL